MFMAGCADDEGGGGGDDSRDSGNRTEKSREADERLDEEAAERNDSYDAPPTARLDASKTWVAKVETTEGEFDIELLPEAGPIAAANFRFLVDEEFYDGVRFHRVLKGFVVQAGDPLGDGTGGPGYEIEDDPVKQPYRRGVVAMANAGPDTGGSQFFIVLSDEVNLPPAYAIFGQVDEEGMEVVDRIAEVKVEQGPNGEPSLPVDVVRILDVEMAPPA